MSYRVLPFPRAGSTGTLRSSRASARAMDIALDMSLDIGFLPSWFAFDSEYEARGRSINWGAVSGMAISIGFSAAFWAGVAWMVARAWR